MEWKTEEWIKLLTLYIYYYAWHGQLGPVRADKTKIYYLNVLCSVLDVMLNNETNEIKKAAAL